MPAFGGARQRNEDALAYDFPVPIGGDQALDFFRRPRERRTDGVLFDARVFVKIQSGLDQRQRIPQDFRQILEP